MSIDGRHLISMTPRTRSTSSSPVKKLPVAPTATSEAKYNPVKVLIAPRDLSPHTRILSLQHPCDGNLKKFMFCPESGLFELKKTTLPSTDLRSILFSSNNILDANEPMVIDLDNDPFCTGYINKDAEILTATPYDLAFMLLRSIAPQNSQTKKSLFQPLDDLLDSPESCDKSMKYIISNGPKLVNDAMSRICDKVEAGDEEMFRYSEEKVFKLMIGKAQRVAHSGLPASLEDQFVMRVLEAPMMSIKREETAISITMPLVTVSEEDQSQNNSFDSQSTTASAVPSTVFSETSTTSTVVTIAEDSVPAEVKQLQRIRTAYNFIAATCLPSFLATRLGSLLSVQKTPVDFTPLEDYLKQLTILRAEAAASRSMTDFSRKRGLEDDEIAEERAEKKRRQEEEEKKRKANESRGVRELKKVNVSGMKKMSDFFAKKPVSATVKTKT